MATTHVVSLFLPYTINFHDEDEPSPEDLPRSESGPLSGPQFRPVPNRVASTLELATRGSNIDMTKASNLDLVSKASTASLFRQSTPPHTPGVGSEVSNQFGPEARKRHFAKPGDPRSLVRTDAHVPEWGAQAVFNQPKSRAGPLPSNSILDFAKVHDELSQEKLNETRRKQRKRRSPPSRGSRAQSVERFAGQSWTVEPAVQGNGGLTNACRNSDGSEEDITWTGTVGFPTDALPDSVKEDIHDRLLNEYQADPVYIADKDFQGHYSHFCKTILWPVFHYQIPDHPKSKAYADHSWGFYKAVNDAFAAKVIASYKKGDIIWIHDYHLLLVPGLVRQKLPDAQIGFFMHTAFPSSEVFRCLANRKELLEGMLGANLVAFQTDEYAQHFLQTCSRLLTVEATIQGVQLEDHFVNVTHAAIGINPALIHEARQDPEVQEWVDTIGERYEGKKIIVAIDKLDNVRGVRQKLLAYELFLNKYPEWREKVVLVQVATSTNEHTELLTTVSDICTRIDSVYCTLAHQPLVFLKQDIDFSQYLALLTVADTLVISSLRDGMNLTAHEYIFCQDGRGGPKKHSPLILSEFTGSAAIFGENHLSINPWNYKEQAEAFKKALEMGDEEKAKRWNALNDVVLSLTGKAWKDQISDALAKVYKEHHLRDSTSIPRLSTAQLVQKYKAAQRRVFIIDYEGTLAPHKTSTGIPLSSPQRVLDTLNELLGDGKNVVYIMSGRKPGELETIFHTVPTLGIIAENGCFMREFGAKSNDWQVFVDLEMTNKWKQDVKAILQYYQERLEDSVIEERHCSLLFRYDKAPDQEMAHRQAGESANHINDACAKLKIHAVPISKAILIEPVNFSKRSAATHIFDGLRNKNTANGLPHADFLMVAGDDREDEVVFRWANELGAEGQIRDVTTVSVGHRNTEAQNTLTQGTTGLLSVLQKLVKASAETTSSDYFSRPSRDRHTSRN